MIGSTPPVGKRRKRLQCGCGNRLRKLETLENRRLLTTYTVTNLDDAGDGSRRSAILAANDSPGADRIRFANDVHGTIELTSGQLEIHDDLRIDGPGTKALSISGGGNSRVFLVDGVKVDLRGLTITEGMATDLPIPLPPDSPSFSEGGGLLSLSGKVTLRDVHVTDNQSVDGVFGLGGGVASLFGAALTVRNCQFRENFARGFAIGGGGGAIHSDAQSTLTLVATP